MRTYITRRPSPTSVIAEFTHGIPDTPDMLDHGVTVIENFLNLAFEPDFPNDEHFAIMEDVYDAIEPGILDQVGMVDLPRQEDITEDDLARLARAAMLIVRGTIESTARELVTSPYVLGGISPEGDVICSDCATDQIDWVINAGDQTITGFPESLPWAVEVALGYIPDMQDFLDYTPFGVNDDPTVTPASCDHCGELFPGHEEEDTD